MCASDPAVTERERYRVRSFLCPWCNYQWDGPPGVKAEGYEYCPKCRGSFSFRKPATPPSPPPAASILDQLLGGKVTATTLGMGPAIPPAAAVPTCELPTWPDKLAAFLKQAIAESEILNADVPRPIAGVHFSKEGKSLDVTLGALAGIQKREIRRLVVAHAPPPSAGRAARRAFTSSCVKCGASSGPYQIHPASVSTLTHGALPIFA